jgi:hypothetical protein
VKRTLVAVVLVGLGLLAGACGSGGGGASSASPGQSVPPCPSHQPGEPTVPTRVTALYCDAHPGEPASNYGQAEFIREIEDYGWKINPAYGATEAGTYQEAVRFCTEAKRSGISVYHQQATGSTANTDVLTGYYLLLKNVQEGNEDRDAYMTALGKTCGLDVKPAP